VKEETGSPNKVDVVGRWPEQRQEGRAAKSFLLEMLTDVETWFDSVPAYTATFHKQERVKGELLQGQTFAIKVRQDPFAIYFRSISPEAGKELIFARGHFKDQVVAHSTGLARLLAPRLQVAPDHPLLMAQSRHPVTDAGLGNLIRRLIHYRRQDLEEAEAETVLDRYQSSDGRKWLRSTHIHHDASNGRPFARTEILYQPDTGLPVQFVGYDWPPQGQTEPVLGERFRYDHLELDATISSKDFDPTNPEYAFHRF
jgi:hypothetical protein